MEYRRIKIKTILFPQHIIIPNGRLPNLHKSLHPNGDPARDAGSASEMTFLSSPLLPGLCCKRLVSGTLSLWLRWDKNDVDCLLGVPCNSSFQSETALSNNDSTKSALSQASPNSHRRLFHPSSPPNLLKFAIEPGGITDIDYLQFD